MYVVFGIWNPGAPGLPPDVRWLWWVPWGMNTTEPEEMGQEP